MTAVDRQSVLPLYYQIKEWLRGAIAEGEYGPDSRIPSENELATKFGVSRNTAKQAISELVSEGVLFREQGRGTFVSPKKMLNATGEHFSFSEELGPESGHLKTKVLSKSKMAASKDTAVVLGIQPGDQICVIRRLRLLDNKPFSLQVSFLPADICPTLLEKDLENEPLFQLLSREYGLIPHRSEEIIEYRPAADFESDPLNVKKGTPLFHILRTTYNANGTAIETVKTYLPAERCRFKFEQGGHNNSFVLTGEIT